MKNRFYLSIAASLFLGLGMMFTLSLGTHAQNNRQVEKPKNPQVNPYSLKCEPYHSGDVASIVTLTNTGKAIPANTKIKLKTPGGTEVVTYQQTFASNTKRDFSFLNKFIFVGFIVIMLGVVANIFLQMPLISLMLCGAFIIFSSAIILWQVNDIVRGGETNYISATLTLYVSIYNIFTSLLQILGIVDRD